MHVKKRVAVSMVRGDDHTSVCDQSDDKERDGTRQQVLQMLWEEGGVEIGQLPLQSLPVVTCMHIIPIW